MNWIRRRATVYTLAAGLFLCGAPHHSWAQPTNNATATSEPFTEQLEQLEKSFASNPDSISLKTMDSLIAEAEAQTDFSLKLRLSDLTFQTAQRQGNKRAEAAAKLHSILLRMMTAGPDDIETLYAQYNLAQIWKDELFSKLLRSTEGFLKNDYAREADRYPIMNVIASAIDLERGGKVDSFVIRIRAYSHSHMGQRMLLASRPFMALYHLKEARERATTAGFTTEYVSNLNRLIGFATDGIEKAGSSVADQCDAKAFQDLANIKICRQIADKIYLENDAAGADKILTELTAPGFPKEMDDVYFEYFEALRDLLFIRLMSLPPEDPRLLKSIADLSEHLAANELVAASVLAAPTALRLWKKGQYIEDVSTKIALIARGWINAGKPVYAMRFLELFRAYNLSRLDLQQPFMDIQPAEDRKRRIAGFLTGYDMAYIAEKQKWGERSKVLLSQQNRIVEKLPIEQTTDLVRELVQWTSAYNARMVPTPAAMAEFKARIAFRMPAEDMFRRSATMGWPLAEQIYRADDSRTINIYEMIIDELPDRPGVTNWPKGEIFAAFSQFLTNLDREKSEVMARGALALFEQAADMPDQTVDVLLQLSLLRQLVGDEAGARALLDAARKVNIREGGNTIETASRLNMRLAQTFLDDGRPNEATDLALSTLLRMIEDKLHQVETIPVARKLAEFYSATNRLSDAKNIYEKYVLPWTRRSSIVGEDMSLDAELSFMEIEALLGPNDEVLTELRNLLVLSRVLFEVSPDRRRLVVRAMAFALQGLGQSQEALQAARQALALSPQVRTGNYSDRTDRRLFETFVGAAWGTAQLAPAHSAGGP